MISQAPTKTVKQISSTSSSRSASPQVSVPQQYIIQQTQQQHPATIYTMGPLGQLSQLGSIIPGLGPGLESSQQAKVNEAKTSSEQQQVKAIHETPVTSHQSILTSSAADTRKVSEDVSNSSTSSAHPVIQIASFDKSQSSSSSSHSAPTNATLTVSSSSSSSAVISSLGGVIMNPYHQYYTIAAAAAAASVSSATPTVTSSSTSSATMTVSSTTMVATSSAVPTTSQAKEKVITYTVATPKLPVASTTTSSSTAAVATTQTSASVAASTVLPTQVQYMVSGTGNQQQLYAMPSSAHIQTGFLFFQQPNGMMVAIPAQTVIQPGGSGQVAVAPQQVAAIANGAVTVQQSQQQKAADVSTTAEKSRAKSESEATSNDAASKQQKQVYLPVMQQPYELKAASGKGKRSSSSTVSEDTTHKSSGKDQAQPTRHHSASSATAGHATKYQHLYIPRGAHAYRVAAAQAAAAQAASSQQSTAVVSTSTTTSVTTSSVTTLEKTKESEEASTTSLVPIQVVHQQQYAKGDRYGVAQQSHKQMITTVTSGGSSNSQKLAMVYASGRPSVLFNTTAGTTPSSSQMMVHAVAQGPTGVYEVKASTIAELDPGFVKTLTDKYEHDIVKIDYQTAILGKSHSTENNEGATTGEVSNKTTKTVSFAPHKDQNRNQTPSSFNETVAAIDRTLASQQTISDDATTTTTTTTPSVSKQTKSSENRRRGQAKKTVQADEKESSKDSSLPVTSPPEKPPAKQAAARKRKGAKADLEGDQDTTQPPKRKRGPAKKKAAPVEDAGEDNSHNKPAKVTPAQRSRKGKATNDTAKGALKTAVVSISLDMLADVPSPVEPDEVSELRNINSMYSNFVELISKST